MKVNPYQDLPAVFGPPGISRRLLAYQAGDNGYTVTDMHAEKGTPTTPHSHPHLQVVYVLSGRGTIRCGEETFTLTAGDILQIPSNVPHEWPDFAEDTHWLEFFTPEREDFKPENL